MKKAGFSICTLLPLLMSFGHADALAEPEICYVLDAILFVYGVVLTVLYCRLKLQNDTGKNKQTPKEDAAERIYEGLAPHAEATYEKINMKKTKA